ncbi:TolB family protein [Carboxylicivirga sp. RSCT41]|uniref:TolB family protein n=1 Tax=Carboxylicivirga agarovorans TaxID=3417570 RepID=UPI003D32955F
MKLNLLIVACLMLPALLMAQTHVKKKPVRLISVDGQVCKNAKWSPDGKMIAFTSEKNNGLYLCNEKGRNVRVLTNDLNVGFGYQWSGDAAHILARSLVKEQNIRMNEVVLYSVDNLEKTVLLERSTRLRCLPQFVDEDAAVAVVIDNDIKRIESGLSQLKGKKEQGLSLVNGAVVKNGQVSFSLAAEFEGRYIFNQVYSPDRKKVVFQVNGLGLYVSDVDGTDLKHLGYGEQAVWLPDNKHLIVAKVKDNGVALTEGVLQVVDVSTGDAYVLLSDPDIIALNPNVSPDGQKVLMDNVGDGAVYLMEIE